MYFPERLESTPLTDTIVCDQSKHIYSSLLANERVKCLAQYPDWTLLIFCYIIGFGRGSKELGIPTANFNEKVVDELPKDLETGIYFGWTNLEGEAIVRKAVVSIGYNPFYENKTKSVVRN